MNGHATNPVSSCFEARLSFVGPSWLIARLSAEEENAEGGDDDMLSLFL
jgi:hypothetical protein